MSGSDWGAIVAGVGSIVATVLGFVLAYRRDASSRVEQLSAEERDELTHRRRWYRVVMRQIVVPLQDHYAARGEPEPVDLERWSQYPPEDQ